MVKEIVTKGFQSFMDAVQSPEVKNKNIICFFSGDKDESGKSWCPDCVVAEPVVRECLKSVDDDEIVFVYCAVGARDYWKDRNNDFRTHTSLKLTGVPTLLKWGSPSQKLVEGQLLKKELITMLLED